MINLLTSPLTDEESQKVKDFLQSMNKECTQAFCGDWGYITLDDLPYIIDRIDELVLETTPDASFIDIDSLTHEQSVAIVKVAADSYEWMVEYRFSSVDIEEVMDIIQNG